MNIFTRIAALCFFYLLLSTSAFSQGNLTPPGPPAATMKTLQQIEPRIDLQNAPASAVTTSDPNYHFIITQPGSYYLSQNFLVTKPNGIQVASDGVTLDLKGFTIRRSSGSGGSAIRVATNADRCTIKDGAIGASGSPGFAYGVEAVNAAPNLPRAGALLRLSAFGCTSAGLSAGDGWNVEGCIAHGNSGFAGINAGKGSTIVNCTAYSNVATDGGISGGDGATLVNCTAFGNTGRGIYPGSGSTVINSTARENTGNGFGANFFGVTYAHCTARLNGGNGIETGPGSTLTDCTAQENSGAYGILAGSGSSLKNCTSSRNTSGLASSGGFFVSASSVIGCTASDNTNTLVSSTRGVGIRAGTGSTVKDCTAEGNAGDGITVTANSLVIANTANGNGAGTGTGAGIHTTSSDNRIEGNNVTDNDRGIEIGSSGSLILRNSASGNTTNYDIAASNNYGVILDVTATAAPAVNGNSATGTLTTTTNPWANFSY